MTGESKSEPAAWPTPTEAEGNPGALEQSWRGVFFLGLVVGVLLAVVYLSPLKEHLARLRDVSQYVRSFGVLAPIVAVLGAATLVAVGFPRLLFCIIAGMAFGFWRGLLWAQLGTLLGNYMVFLGVRFAGSSWTRKYRAKTGRLHNLIQREGIAGVVLARQLPLPGLIINVACALFHVRHRHYLLGTALGQLPQAIPCTLIGAGALQASFSRSLGLIGAAVAMAVVGWLVLHRFLRRWLKSS